jgi:NAD(P)-dependent dehydrogenase (short-subunit alcohol dehydrogenase family)
VTPEIVSSRALTQEIPDSIPRAALIVGELPYGFAIARALTNAGFAVALQCDRTQTGLTAAAPAATLLPTDLVDPNQRVRLFDRASAALGSIGVLVNGMTLVGRDDWHEATQAIWDRQFALTLRLPFMLTQQFAEALPAGREGVVINLLDQRISPSAISFSVANGARATLTQTMALALAPAIRVNSVAIGPALRGRDNAAGTTEDSAAPDNVAEAVLAVLALRSMTGQMMIPGGRPFPRHRDNGESTTSNTPP